MKRVLVLDDDFDILNLVKTILTMNGYEAQTIANWEQLNSSLEQFKPNVLLLDISLAGANGIDICRNLKMNDRTKQLPVVLFSANIEMAKKASECGAADYLSKPFSIKELISAIEKNAD